MTSSPIAISVRSTYLIKIVVEELSIICKKWNLNEVMFFLSNLYLENIHLQHNQETSLQLVGENVILCEGIALPIYTNLMLE